MDVARVMRIALAREPPTVVVNIDGMPVGAPIAIEVGTSIVVSIQLGAFFTGPQEGAVEVVYDNVVVRTFSP